MYQLRFFSPQRFIKMFTFFQSPGKEPQHPYDQNGGSITPRSLIFDPFAKETVSPKTHILGGRRRRRRRRISRPSLTPFHHAGITYPVWVQPLTPISSIRLSAAAGRASVASMVWVFVCSLVCLFSCLSVCCPFVLSHSEICFDIFQPPPSLPL